MQLSHMTTESLQGSQKQFVPSRRARSTYGNLSTFCQIRSSINLCLFIRIDSSFSRVQDLSSVPVLNIFNGFIQSQTHWTRRFWNCHQWSGRTKASWSRNLFATKATHLFRHQKEEGGAAVKEARTQFSHQEEAPCEAP